MSTTPTRWWPRFIAHGGHLIDRLYRWRLGWLLGHRFAMLTHEGRPQRQNLPDFGARERFGAGTGT